MDENKRKRFEDIEDYSQEKLDQLLVYLSSGGLVLSLSFLNQVECHQSTWLIISTWLSFCLALILSLLSHKTALWSSDNLIRGEEERGVLWDKITGWLDSIALLAFFLAVILFILFAIKNI